MLCLNSLLFYNPFIDVICQAKPNLNLDNLISTKNECSNLYKHSTGYRKIQSIRPRPSQKKAKRDQKQIKKKLLGSKSKKTKQKPDFKQNKRRKQKIADQAY